MRIASAELFRYLLPLARTLALPGHELSDRTGLLVRLRSEDGMVGWGDVAPLPGFSSETVFDAEQELRALMPLLSANCVWAEESGLWSGVDLRSCAPSVVFGLETALAGLADAVSATSPNLLGLPEFVGAIAVNGLLVGDRDEVLREGRGLTEKGYRTLKLKLGRRSLADDVALTHAVRDALGKHAVIRLDPNRSWSLREAIQFGEAVGPQGIAYIEEPLAEPEALPRFFQATGIPVALDESLRELASEDLVGREDVGAVVLKPTLMGGIAKVRQWAKQAMNAHMLPVISSTFESGVGILALARLASSLGRPDIAVGLDTYRWLDRDVIKPRLRFENGAVHSRPGADETYELDGSLLQEIQDA